MIYVTKEPSKSKPFHFYFHCQAIRQDCAYNGNSMRMKLRMTFNTDIFIHGMNTPSVMSVCTKTKEEWRKWNERRQHLLKLAANILRVCRTSKGGFSFVSPHGFVYSSVSFFRVIGLKSIWMFFGI